MTANRVHPLTLPTRLTLFLPAIVPLLDAGDVEHTPLLSQGTH